MKSIAKFRIHMGELCDHDLMQVAMADVEKCLDEIERELEEEYVELPTDANGDVWRVDDLIVGEVNQNNPKRVERMLWYGPDLGWELETDSIIYPCPERPRHYHEPTVEDVLQKLLEQAVGYSDAHTTVALDTIAEYAERLQLREED